MDRPRASIGFPSTLTDLIAAEPGMTNSTAAGARVHVPLSSNNQPASVLRNVYAMLPYAVGQSRSVTPGLSVIHSGLTPAASTSLSASSSSYAKKLRNAVTNSDSTHVCG